MARITCEGRLGRAPLAGLSARELDAVLLACFPGAAPLRPLKRKNAGDMKWKKFFYRQLCEAAEVPICKSPSCAECCDYSVCFGPES
jgi:nitrogen fixation protein NifQ